MTRVNGGALAAIGAIALNVTPIVHYALPVLRNALPKAPVIVTAPHSTIKTAPFSTAKIAPPPAVATAPPAATPDCASTRSKKDVRVVGHTITNKTAKKPNAPMRCP